MDEYSHVLALLRAWAADHLRRAPSGKKPEIANKTTERALRNRALAICQRLQGMAEPQRPRYLEDQVKNQLESDRRRNARHTPARGFARIAPDPPPCPTEIIAARS